MTTFALVHGAWHNGSCWDPTAAVLRQRGHEVITMDLPCTDPAAGLEEYATVVLDAIGDARVSEVFTAAWTAYSAEQTTDDSGAARWPAEAAAAVFYHDCSDEQAAEAVVQLRPQVWKLSIQPSPLTAYPDVPTHAIVCAEDRVLQADTCARLAEERFGARVTRLGGGHSPMIAQPEALADALTSGMT